MMARYHDPAYGRFTQTDPLGGPMGPGVVSYVYAANSPLVFGDPSGLCHTEGNP